MNIDEKGVWSCEDCGFSGTFDDVKKHKEAVKVAREYFKGKVMING